MDRQRLHPNAAARPPEQDHAGAGPFGWLMRADAGVDAAGGPDRDNNFDILRLVFASLVVVHHFSTLSNFGYGGIFFNLGHSSVLGFFVISGFLIYWSYDKGRDLGAYTMRRLFRIFPLYAVTIALQVIIFMQIVPPRDLAELGRYIAANMVFLNFLQPNFGVIPDHLPQDYFNGSLWTIKIEVFFYALVPFWLLLPGQRFWAVMMFIASSLFYLHFAYNSDTTKLATQIPPGQLRFFAVGMLLYMTVPLKGLSQRGVLALLALALGIFFTGEYVKEFKPGSIWIEAAFVMLDPLSLGLAVYLVAFRLRPISIPLDISYGVYLIHFPLYQILMMLEIFQDNALAFFLTVAVSTYVLAYLSARYLEGPAMEAGRWSARRIKGLIVLPHQTPRDAIPGASRHW
ncbi:MAG: acyltransferase family protein [Alphaproteobacteria bacterium]